MLLHDIAILYTMILAIFEFLAVTTNKPCVKVVDSCRIFFENMV